MNTKRLFIFIHVVILLCLPHQSLRATEESRLRPLGTSESANVLNALRSELRATENFETLIRRARKELSRYILIVNTQKLRNPEQGEQLFDRLFDLRLWFNTIHPDNNQEYRRWREVKDGIMLLLMQTAREILELDRHGSYDYKDWGILASARRYVVKLRAITLKEITNRQLLEDMMDGLEDATDFIAGVDIDEYKEEFEFVYAQIVSTAQNVTARIVELEHERSEIRKAA